MDGWCSNKTFHILHVRQARCLYGTNVLPFSFQIPPRLEHHHVFMAERFITMSSVIGTQRDFRSALHRKRPERPQERSNSRKSFWFVFARRSARKDAPALWQSNRTVRRILHTGLKFHPEKLMSVQGLLERNSVSRRKGSIQQSNCILFSQSLKYGRILPY